MYKFQERAQAAEIVNAGVCNLDCAYCYIPKTDKMKEMHADIVEYLDSGRFIEDLLATFGTGLTAISPWGTEPTLTIEYFTKWMPELVKTFPDLRSINFSTNMLRNPKYLLEFLESLPKDRGLEWQLQYSIDGPEDINDVTRMKGATARIRKNVIDFLAEASRYDLGDMVLHANCKATWDETIIRMVGQDLSKVVEFLDFFNRFYGEIDEVLTNDNVTHGKVNAPFLALPGNYTVQDGKYFSDITKELLRLQALKEAGEVYRHLSPVFVAYIPRLHRIVDYGIEFFTKPFMFTCSAGDSLFGIDHNSRVSPCHRIFYMNDERYVSSIVEDCSRVNWHASHYENDRLNEITTFMSVAVDDDHALARLAYSNSAYHNFLRHRLTVIKGLVRIMAEAGQLSPIYKDDDFATFYAEFIATAFSCPIEYQLTSANITLTPPSILRVTGNGMFETMVRSMKPSSERDRRAWFK